MWFLITAFDADIKNGERTIRGFTTKVNLTRYLISNDWDRDDIEEFLSQGYKKDGSTSYWANKLHTNRDVDITLP